MQVRVSKELKRLEKMFYGSSQAYDKALMGETRSWTAFIDALIRNVYNGEEDKRPFAELLGRYLLR